MGKRARTSYKSFQPRKDRRVRDRAKRGEVARERVDIVVFPETPRVVRPYFCESSLYTFRHILAGVQGLSGPRTRMLLCHCCLRIIKAPNRLDLAVEWTLICTSHAEA